MRETEGSLRRYFVVAGLIALGLGLRDLNTAAKLAGILGTLSITWNLAIWVPIIGRLLLGVGYLAAGLKLKTALMTGAAWIQNLLVGAIVLFIIEVVLVASVVGTELGRRDMIGSVIGLVVTAYLLANLRRLAAEAMANNPPARVAG